MVERGGGGAARGDAARRPPVAAAGQRAPGRSGQGAGEARARLRPLRRRLNVYVRSQAGGRATSCRRCGGSTRSSGSGSTRRRARWHARVDRQVPRLQLLGGRGKDGSSGASRPKALGAMKERVREITSRNGGRSLPTVVCGAAELPARAGRSTSSWPRRPASSATSTSGSATGCGAVQLKQWKRGTTVYRELRARGMRPESAAQVAANARRWWQATRAWPSTSPCPTSYFDELGVPRLAAVTSTARTAGCGPACPVVWEGSGGHLPPPPIPISGPLTAASGTRTPGPCSPRPATAP